MLLQVLENQSFVPAAEFQKFCRKIGSAAKDGRHGLPDVQTRGQMGTVSLPKKSAKVGCGTSKHSLIFLHFRQSGKSPPGSLVNNTFGTNLSELTRQRWKIILNHCAQ